MNSMTHLQMNKINSIPNLVRAPENAERRSGRGGSLLEFENPSFTVMQFFNGLFHGVFVESIMSHNCIMFCSAFSWTHDWSPGLTQIAVRTFLAISFQHIAFVRFTNLSHIAGKSLSFLYAGGAEYTKYPFGLKRRFTSLSKMPSAWCTY